jgi:hypothetical protein
MSFLQKVKDKYKDKDKDNKEKCVKFTVQKIFY